MACSKKNKVNCCFNDQSDHLVCVCMGVMQSDITQAIDKGSDTFEKLSKELGVGTGCESCVAEVNDIVMCKKK